MKLKNIIVASFLLYVSISLITAEGEQISGDTVFINTPDCYIGVTPHTLTESGYIDVCIKSKSYSGVVDIEYGFDTLSGKPFTFEHNPKELNAGESPTFDKVIAFNKVENKNFDGKHLWYCDKNKIITSNTEQHIRVWINIVVGTSGKYDVVVRTPQFVWVLDPLWESVPTIISGLTNVGAHGAPSIFYMDNKWNLISGKETGAFQAWDWGGAVWVANATLYGGLIDYGTLSAVEVFEQGGIRYLIASHGNAGTWYGYNWSGSLWQADTDIVSGLTTMGNYNRADTFNISGILYFVAGDNSGTFKGWNWTGSTWQLDTNIINGLSISSGYSSPEAFKKNNVWYLVSGSTDLLKWFGWVWKNDKWVSDDDLISGIGEVGNNGVPAVYSIDGITFNLITGCSAGTWVGYQAFLQSSPNNLENSSGYTWVNWTWGDSEDGKYSIDGYNVSNNGCWYNISNAYHNHTEMLPARESNITIWSYNITNGVGINSINGTSWSGLFNGSSKTGINGFVYDGFPGSTKPINDAIISVFNATWASEPIISNADGYYYIYGLENTSYSVTCSKDRYDTVYSIYVTPTKDIMYNKDLYMQTAVSEYYKRHYVTFTVKNLYQIRYPNINVTVYENNIVEDSGVTGYDGSVVFHLLEDTEYSILFINATQGINKEISLFPRDNEYTIYVSNFSFNPDRDVLHDNVQWWYLKNEINLTHSWLNFSYRNDDNKTSYIEYWINDTNDTILLYSSEPYPCSAGTCEINHVVNATNHTYIVHFSATHPDYPSLANSNIQTINFFTDKLINLFFTEQWHYTVVSICILMFIGLLFGATNAAKGGLIIVLSAWFFSFIQWLPSSLIGYSALVLATILSVGWCMRKSEVVHT